MLVGSETLMGFARLAFAPSSGALSSVERDAGGLRALSDLACGEHRALPNQPA